VLRQQASSFAARSRCFLSLGGAASREPDHSLEKQYNALPPALEKDPVRLDRSVTLLRRLEEAALPFEVERALPAELREVARASYSVELEGSQ